MTSTLAKNPAPHTTTRNLAERFAVSAGCRDGIEVATSEVHAWFDERKRTSILDVGTIELNRLRGWGFDADGNLRHESGRFFAVEGLGVRTDWEHGASWTQPIINQPEIGVLGILVKEFDGVLHLLMQTKVEPGNVGGVQLSPTVQATRSNYLGVHQGRSVPMMEYFLGGDSSNVLVDVLQSEQGAWFLRKRNRNMVVETTDDVADHPDFRWLTLGQVHDLLLRDNAINMDARTVLSCIPWRVRRDMTPRDVTAGPRFVEALDRGLDTRGPAMHTDAAILHWLTDIKARHELIQRSIPMSALDGWYRTSDALQHESGKYFRVVAAEVTATNREVASWTQPLIEPVDQGLAVFLARPVDGVLHILIHAKMEAGVLDVAELAPSLQCQPRNHHDLEPGRMPRFLTEALAGTLGTTVYSAVQSEEGGRFLYADNRYEVIDVGTDFPLDGLPPEYLWITPGQLISLLLHSNYINVQARSLMACLQACA